MGSLQPAQLTDAELRFVLSCRVARLATAGADGEPHAVPVAFAWLDGCFYTAVDEKPKTTRRLKRLRNMRTHGRRSSSTATTRTGRAWPGCWRGEAPKYSPPAPPATGPSRRSANATRNTGRCRSRAR